MLPWGPEKRKGGKRRMKRALSAKEAQVELNLSRSLFYRMVKEGRLKVVRAGRKVLVPEWAVDEFLKQTK